MVRGFERKSSRPNSATIGDGGYSQRLNDSLDIYNASQEMPATMYATTVSPLSSHLAAPSSEVTGRKSWVVSRIERMQGLKFNWAWGGNDMMTVAQNAGLPQNGGGLNGTVNNSTFQRVLVHLHDWQTNSKWYIVYPMAGGVFMGGNPVRTTYPSFRSPQISTRTSGGPGGLGVRMQPRPRFTSVQNVPRYNAAPSVYNTRGGGSGRLGKRMGRSSNVNTPGV